jgi:hypothetical protein
MSRCLLLIDTVLEAFEGDCGSKGHLGGLAVTHHRLGKLQVSGQIPQRFDPELLQPVVIDLHRFFRADFVMVNVIE